MQNLQDLSNKSMVQEGWFDCNDSHFSLVHSFTDGIYCRSGTIPRDMVVVGHKHKHKCMNILSQGRMTVWIDGVIKELVAPCIFESKAGSRKILYTKDDVVFTNIFSTTTTNLEELRKELTIEEDVVGLELITKELICGQQ